MVSTGYSLGNPGHSLAITASLENRMSAGLPAVISYNSATPFSHPMVFHLKSPTPISFHEFPTLKPGFVGRSRSRRLYSWKFSFLGRKQMTEMSRISSSTRDAENGGYMETEAMLNDGSSELQRGFWPGELESTINKSSKWLLGAMFGSLILLKHDAEVLWATAGAVLNFSLSVSLKKTLDQQRPASTLRSDPGMPSSHSQCIFYATIFAIASLIKWQGTNALSITVGAVFFLCGSYLSWLRVSQQLHTVSQVVVGAIFGSICSILWFWLWHAFMLEAYVSFLWVRIIVILGSVIFCPLLLYVTPHWHMEEN